MFSLVQDKGDNRMRLNLDFLAATFFLSLKSIPVTINIVVVTLIISIPAAFFIAIINLQPKRLLSKIFRIYISFVRGTPLVILIFLLYNSAPGFIDSVFKIIGLKINVYKLNNIIYAYMVFSFTTTATLSEVFRAGLSTIPKGQLEAAHSMGLTTFQGYVHIIIPQSLTASMPVLCNSAIGLVKSTSLAFIMTVREVTGTARVAAANGLQYLEAYLDIFLIYIILCISIEQIFKAAERYNGRYKANVINRGTSKGSNRRYT
jgi:L-cystine transport system permease protein